MDIISAVIYTKKEGLATLNEETELKKHVDLKKKTIHIIRTGLPQGLSMSPIIATLVLELSKPPKGLTLFADDGLVIGRTREEIAV